MGPDLDVAERHRIDHPPTSPTTHRPGRRSVRLTVATAFPHCQCLDTRRPALSPASRTKPMPSLRQLVAVSSVVSLGLASRAGAQSVTGTGRWADSARTLIETA